jgi:hypothetical protein
MFLLCSFMGGRRSAPISNKATAGKPAMVHGEGGKNVYFCFGKNTN